MSDTPPDISQYLFPAIASLLMAIAAYTVTGQFIVAGIAAIVAWRIVSNMTGRVGTENQETTTPARQAPRGGAGAADGTNVIVSSQARQALTRKLAKLRDEESTADASTSSQARSESRAKPGSAKLKRAEARLNKALVRKQRASHAASATEGVSTKSTSQRTTSAKRTRMPDPNDWWLEAFAALDAKTAAGTIGDAQYDREYERIVRRREAELRSQELLSPA